MNINIRGINLALDDKICKNFKEKLLYDISEKECILYAESFFDKAIDDIMQIYPSQSVAKAIEDAMLKEIEL